MSHKNLDIALIDEGELHLSDKNQYKLSDENSRKVLFSWQSYVYYFLVDKARLNSLLMGIRFFSIKV
ncbi:hypothetical protein [Confluentibacter flavum]|uniref:Uncharacterized protein n=1 Tax=Confluentibacter flavum TaxID=1909700 RepID=A0A2N3HMZ1_9FLAO|nr:hypothetical protein [Confluentibacter flavum]PKQ46295.1 hypothetical protein CSW08_03800 [Confluentibacter flavum]